MAAKRPKKKSTHPVFDSIRKPTAPPSKRFPSDKLAEKTRPTGRKAKHKSRLKDGDDT